MLKTIFVFDLGKVLLDFDYGIAVNRLSGHCTASRKEIEGFIGATPLLLAYEEGFLTTREFFLQVKQATGFSGELEEFRGFFADIFTPIEPMIHLHAACREAGHETYIFSNTNELAVDFIRAQFPFFSRFSAHILSYECKSMKPATGMYEALEKLTGRGGQDIVYVDDRPENIETAIHRGWQAVLHKTPGETIPRMSRHLGL